MRDDSQPAPHPYAGKPRAFFEALDLPAVFGSKWTSYLAATGGDADAARTFFVDMLEWLHSAPPPASTPPARKVSFGGSFRWDHRRYLRANRKNAKGKRLAMRIWRATTKAARRG